MIYKVSFLLVFFSAVLYSQLPLTLNSVNYHNDALPDIESDTDYGFSWPVNADILSNVNYIPSNNNRYFMSLFGPRYKTGSGSNRFDFHQGEDITPVVSFGGVNYNETTKYHEICMCDGEITSKVVPPDPESTETGIYVTVKCDSTFRTSTSGIKNNWGNIFIHYRHLTSIHNGMGGVGSRIEKGDTIGIVGNTGTTSLTHLHLSVTRYAFSHINVHPMRIFAQTSPRLHRRLETADVKLMHMWQSDSALFRLAIPYNQMTVKRITVRLSGTSYEKVYDYEYVSQQIDRDNPDVIDGLSVYPYEFNRMNTAYSRYMNSETNLPPAWPGSITQRDLSWKQFPIPNSLPYNSFNPIVYVMDVMARGLPSGYDPKRFEVEISDIYGYVVKSTIPADIPLPVTLQQFKADYVDIQRAVKLSWITESEIDNAYWLIERQKFAEGNLFDDKGYFEVIGTIKGQGNKSTATIYNFWDRQIDQNWNYAYRLTDISYSGMKTNHKTVPIFIAVPQVFQLYQNYPNPANPTTTIQYDVPKATMIELNIYNILGVKIRTLYKAHQNSGRHRITWDGKDNLGKEVASGVYLYQIKAEGFVKVKKLVLLK